MDFSLTEREERLKREIAEFAKKELPPGWLGESERTLDERDWDFTMSIAKKLGQKGWLTLSWPKEYGGGGVSPTESFIFRDETAYWGIPGTMMGASGTCWVGPSIILFGTEEQKKKYLPLIAKGEPDGVWATGYSEPNSGTDLASLTTRAIRKGDKYIVNGQKTWTSMGHRARWFWLLAITNPNAPKKHKGLSVLIVDLKSPGVTLRPIIHIAGTHYLNETFLDNVEVPASNLVGVENRGWYQVMAALNFERSTLAATGYSRRILAELIPFVKEMQLDKDPLIRKKLAQASLEIETVRLLGYRIAWMQTKGLVAATDASMGKALNSEAKIRLAHLAMEIVGSYSYLTRDSKWAKLMGVLREFYLWTFSTRFAAGTNEIQRDIIAQMGLGLPAS